MHQQTQRWIKAGSFEAPAHDLLVLRVTYVYPMYQAMIDRGGLNQ